MFRRSTQLVSRTSALSSKQFMAPVASRFYISRPDSTLGKAKEKLATYEDDIRKAKELLEEMKQDAVEHKKVFHESRQHISDTLEKSKNEMKELLTNHKNENVDALKKEIAELKNMVKELTGKK